MTSQIEISYCWMSDSFCCNESGTAIPRLIRHPTRHVIIRHNRAKLETILVIRKGEESHVVAEKQVITIVPSCIVHSPFSDDDER